MMEGVGMCNSCLLVKLFISCVFMGLLSLPVAIIHDAGDRRVRQTDIPCSESLDIEFI